MMAKSAACAILAIAFAAVWKVAVWKASTSSLNLSVPPGAVYIDPLMYNVVGADYKNWRNSSNIGFNPTNTLPPFIQVFDPSFLDITGPSATIRAIASNPGFAFAHEAPIYVPDLNVVFFSSNGGGPLGYSGWYNNSVVSMINMTEVDMALASITGDVNVPIQTATHGRNVRVGERMQDSHGKECQIGSSKTGTLSLEGDTSFIGSSCGGSCPSLWRSIREYGPHGIFNWDVRYNVERVFEGRDVEWRLCEGCANPRCARNSDGRDWPLWVTACAVPADEVDIAIQEQNITRHLPPYTTLYIGALYATGGQQPVLVRIPLRHHISVFRFPIDLKLAYWVNQRDVSGRVSFALNYTHAVHYALNGMARDLSAPYQRYVEKIFEVTGITAACDESPMG